ncbi:MAG: phosphomannose isomerase type II C-terminal cupin domain [Alphaproteobacteria bacterium]|jgi:mannose-6-phosphate isomerase-like protein (cupin superfamily)|nr:phosphomannose isomerase type II C-terminal cupin domain [Alphaproteobacteria bacterium]
MEVLGYKKSERGSRPWGEWEVIETGTDFIVKKITVLPKKRLSLQSHDFRFEHWIIVKGNGKVTIKDDIFDCASNDSFFIPVKEKHRIENISESDELIFIEVQTGEKLTECDIVRYEDDFGRG